MCAVRALQSQTLRIFARAALLRSCRTLSRVRNTQSRTQWHVYVADAHGADAAYQPPAGKPFHKFEVRPPTQPSLALHSLYKLKA